MRMKARIEDGAEFCQSWSGYLHVRSVNTRLYLVQRVSLNLTPFNPLGANSEKKLAWVI